MASPTASARLVRELALEEAGFDAVGIAAAEALEPGEEGARFRRWIEEGRAGEMSYLARNAGRRLDPARVLPGARSVIAVALNHGGPRAADREAGGAGDREAAPRGAVARYARGRDYHKVFDRRLRLLEARIHDAFPGAATRRYVDTGPVMEKLWAERAGLGWRGKHTNLVSRDFGSWLLLGEVLTDLELAPDDPEEDYCGTCTRCITACPTGAITGPYRLDATLCVSYLTIELRGPIPKPLRPGVGARVFGCDDCLDVCPWNRFARRARESEFRPRPALLAPLLHELVDLDDEGFLARFAGTAVMRARRAGLARNACVALGNTGGPGAVEALTRALGDPSPLVREHAAWGLGRIGAPAALRALREAREREEDGAVLETIEEGLSPRPGAE